jgi:diaminopimelate decarboxylase
MVAACRDPVAFDDALRRARRVFEEALLLGYKLDLLDVGGGFPGSETMAVMGPGVDVTLSASTLRSAMSRPSSHVLRMQAQQPHSFEAISAVLRESLEKYFPDRSIRIIAEPGRCDLILTPRERSDGF